MKQVVWKDSYKIGVDFIDEEHKKLFSRINKLLKVSEDEEKSEWACREGVKYLKSHTVEHFEHEEAYMQSIQYSAYEAHKRLHDDFRYQTLPALEAELEETEYSEESIRHFIGVCIGWVVGHTQTVDQALAGRPVNEWIDISEKEEKKVLETVIMQLVPELFHMDIKLVSEQYGGENFGKIVCNRFVYRSKKKEKWEVTLAFEEKLLLQVISGILNTEYKRVDDMVINVTRYLSRQFLEKLRASLPMIDLMELEKECLLTYEQLQNSYDRKPPTYSLLFRTKGGYFVFGASADVTAYDKISSAVDPQHAMAAVMDYLSKEKEQPQETKLKILVVDDSDFMRTKMVKLLQEDYDLIEADSSISAIKTIAKKRPNLILLDYEMPVCDGRRMLEMIRSDKDIADIPVIFLTGRGDRESVKTVLSLKPEGYLLKTMSDEVIKKNIDDFFAKRKKS